MYKVCILGAPLDTGNMGVSALAASLVKIVLQIRWDAQIFFLVGRRSSAPYELDVCSQELQIPVVNYRLSFKARLQEHLLWIFFCACLYGILPFPTLRSKLTNINPFLKSMAEADFMGDIRGGDSFSDIYGLGNFILGAMPIITALLLGKKLVLLPQTYGPYSSTLSKVIAGFILKRACHILSRDIVGLNTVKCILRDHRNIVNARFCPDVAFVLDSDESAKSNIYPPFATHLDKPIVGLNISGLLFNGGYTRSNMFGLKSDYKLLVLELIARFLKETDADILLIPHTFAPEGHVESDPDACRYVADVYSGQHRDRIHLVTGSNDQFQLKGIIGGCSFFIGSRMHACIAAVSQGIPAVGLAYSHKFKGVFDSVDLGQMVLDMRCLDMETIIHQILELFQHRSKEQAALSNRITYVQNRVMETFRELLF